MKRLILVFAVAMMLMMACADNITQVTQVTERIVEDGAIVAVNILICDSINICDYETGSCKYFRYIRRGYVIAYINGRPVFTSTLLTIQFPKVSDGVFNVAKIYIMKGDTLGVKRYDTYDCNDIIDTSKMFMDTSICVMDAVNITLCKINN
jgi:hypothetical protein